MEKSKQNSALRRLQIIQGQLKGLMKMIEEEMYCVDIITQTSAIKEALTGIELLMLENHLATHVVHQMKMGKESKAIDEILKVWKLTQKKK